MATSRYQQWEDQIDRWTHDAEHKESGAAMARKMGDRDASDRMNAEAATLRQQAADLSLYPPSPIDL